MEKPQEEGNAEKGENKEEKGGKLYIKQYSMKKN